MVWNTNRYVIILFFANFPVAKIPGRVKCVNEEATEELVCQEHCLPKGYSYGICVRGTCSCI